MRKHGKAVTVKKTIRSSVELYQGQQGGGDVENIASDSDHFICITKTTKVRHILTGVNFVKTKVNLIGNEFVVVVVYGNLYYHFGVEGGTKIREVCAAFTDYYKRSNPHIPLNFAVRLSSNFVMLRDDDTVLKTEDAYIANLIQTGLLK